MTAGDDVAAQVAAAVRALARERGERDAPGADVHAAGELLPPLARRCGADLERFLNEIAVGAQTDALDPRAEAVTLLTLYGAKAWSSMWCSWPTASAVCCRGGCPWRLSSRPISPRDGGCCSSG